MLRYSFMVKSVTRPFHFPFRFPFRIFAWDHGTPLETQPVDISILD